MTIYGYGYRKDCFGETLFFEDRLEVYSEERLRSVLDKGFGRMYRERQFSMKAVSETGESWAISHCLNKEKNGLYNLLYSRAWNSTDPEKPMKKADIIEEIVRAL